MDDHSAARTADPARGRAPALVPVLTGVGGFVLGVVVTSAVVAGTVLAAPGSTAVRAAGSRGVLLPAAIRQCAVDTRTEAHLGADGRTVTMVLPGDAGGAAGPVQDLQCLHAYLRAPASVVEAVAPLWIVDPEQPPSPGNVSWRTIREAWTVDSAGAVRVVLTDRG